MSEERPSADVTIELAQDAAIYSVELLAKNYKRLPPIPPEIITTAFLAALSIWVIDAMPLEDKDKTKKDLIELINGYEVE